MFGLTEFNIFREKEGWVIKLVTGRNNTPVLVGARHYSSGHKAYVAAKRLWEKLKREETKNLLPVRYADLDDLQDETIRKIE